MNISYQVRDKRWDISGEFSKFAGNVSFNRRRWIISEAAMQMVVLEVRYEYRFIVKISHIIFVALSDFIVGPCDTGAKYL